jgi:hypothetical protein
MPGPQNTIDAVKDAVGRFYVRTHNARAIHEYPVGAVDKEVSASERGGKYSFAMQEVRHHLAEQEMVRHD